MGGKEGDKHQLDLVSFKCSANSWTVKSWNQLDIRS